MRVFGGSEGEKRGLKGESARGEAQPRWGRGKARGAKAERGSSRGEGAKASALHREQARRGALIAREGKGKSYAMNN